MTHSGPAAASGPLPGPGSQALIPRSIDDVWASSAPELPHVLLIVDQFPRALGGGERALLRLAAQLPEYGFRASVLTFAIHPESSVLTAPLPFPVYLLPLTRTYDLTALRAARALGRFVREQNVRIVQTFFESSDLWAGAVVKALSSARLVWSRRDMGILRAAKHRIAYRLMAGLPDRVFAVSDRVRQHCVDVDQIDPLRVCTIYNGLDLPASLPAHRSEGIFSVITVGNIRRVKGHDLFLRAAALVLEEHPETRFSIAGDVLEPDYYQQLEGLVRDLGLGDRFQFTGGVRDTLQHLQQADLFVLPSRSEGFSNAILEAMACGLPVIATDVGGNAEAVQDGVNGFVIKAEDTEALAARIGRLAGDRDEARRLGAAGRLLAETRFSTGAMMRQISSAYRELIAGL